MPRLGLGLGLSRSKTISNPEKELIKLSSFYIDPDKANGFKRPTEQNVNDPFINPIQDQAGNADVTLVGFAETVDSGYKVVTNGAKSFTMLNFDGVNDYGDLVASEAPNPTGLQDFAQLVVWRAKDEGFANRYFGLSRNDLNLSTRQYALNNTLDGRIFYAVNGISVEIQNIPNDVLSYAIFGRINGRRFFIRNGIELHESPYNESIIERTNVQMGTLSSASDGSTKSDFANGTQGVCAFFYDGDNPLDKTKIVDTCKKFVAYKYGL